MSTDYHLSKRVRACRLLDGRLEKCGIREEVVADSSTKNSRCLTDGRNYLWVYINDDGFVACLTRYAGNAPGKILDAIADTFDTDIVSEHEPQFWGFNTEEEWNAYQEQIAKEQADAFHIELLKYLRGEASDIKRGTVGMLHAKIAKRLVKNDPSLMLPKNKGKLRKKIDSIYERDHAVRVTLSPREIAHIREGILKRG